MTISGRNMAVRIVVGNVKHILMIFLLFSSLPIFAADAPIITINSHLPSGTYNVAYANGWVEASCHGCGIGAYTWQVTSGSLPAGLLLCGQSINDTQCSVSGTPTSGGTNTFTVQVTDSLHRSSATQTLSITISKAATTISWPTPAPIAYGTPLSATQLNAAFSVPGSCTYNPPSGAVLAAGAQTLSVTCNPNDSNDYTPANASVPLTVNQAPLAVTAGNASRSYGSPNPAFSATYSGFVNGDNQSILSGTPSFTTPAGPSSPVGTYTITVAQGSLSAANYSFASFTPGQLTIMQASPTISWPVPAPIDYGTRLSTTQLNATFSVPGLCTYYPTPGTVLAAGAQTLSVTCNPTDSTDYTSAGATVPLIVNAPLTLGTTILPGGAKNQSYTATLVATGGTPSYSWSLASGSLPVGLTLSTSGVISGAPTTATNSRFSVTVNDSATPPQSTTQSLSIAIASSPLTPPSQAAGYNLVFTDDFDDPTLNLSPNGLDDYYWYNPGMFWESAVPAPATNIAVANSILTLTWNSGQDSSACVPPIVPKTCALWDTSIATAAIDGSYYRAWTYGYFEARLNWDPVTGSWPAFWMIPLEGMSQNGNPGAATQGEFDIMEGQGYYANHLYFTLHIWVNGTDQGPGTYDYTVPSGVSLSDYHTYGLLWTPGNVVWYFDNNAVTSVTYTNSTLDSQHYYLILGSQEGANWSYGDMTNVTASSIPVNVDWVHVWHQ